MALVVAFNLEAFDYMEATFRVSTNINQYYVLGACWTLSALVGAISADIVAKRLRSLTNTATLFTLLTVPGLVYFSYLVTNNAAQT